MLVEFGEAVTVDGVEAILVGDHIDVVSRESDPPSNLSAAGQEDIMVRVRSADEGEKATRFWLWLAADNLKLAALNAIACATELRRLRPLGKVQ
jgi:aspartate-semialdehyde dehydrogenase